VYPTQCTDVIASGASIINGASRARGAAMQLFLHILSGSSVVWIAIASRQVITRMNRVVRLAVLSCIAMSAVWTHADDVTDLFAQPATSSALEALRASEPELIRDQIRICQIPAPPFHEAARAAAMKTAFEQAGLSNVRVDRVGNVLGDWPGVAAKPHVVVAAHLDTVFPEGTEVRITRDGSRLRGPGIGDDCRGLAVLLAIAKTIATRHLQVHGSITFVADVGEEGLGDLRGVRELFTTTLKGTVDQFVSIDGAGLFLTTGGVGSRRYRVTFFGPGGHSYAAFGTPNPIHTMGRAIEKIADLHVPTQPKTTFSVGRVGGGTSVNSIPAECWMEVDLRSVSTTELASLAEKFEKTIDAAVREENARWTTTERVRAKTELVGERPAGRTSADSIIVQRARRVARTLGLALPENDSSTDANIPMQLGIPAVTIGAGGSGSGQHTVGETFDSNDSWRGTQFGMLLTLALAR
jgi:acetylornithine deacetylase/succinyl-diaminopimelate desuccinylase-like protein